MMGFYKYYRMIAQEIKVFQEHEHDKKDQSVRWILFGLRRARALLLESVKEGHEARIAHKRGINRWRAAELYNTLKQSLHYLESGQRLMAIDLMKRTLDKEWYQPKFDKRGKQK